VCVAVHVAVCCSCLERVARCRRLLNALALVLYTLRCCNVFSPYVEVHVTVFAEVCCSVLQCVAVCCSV